MCKSVFYRFQQGQVSLDDTNVTQHEYCIEGNWNDATNDVDLKLLVCSDAAVMYTHNYHSIRYTVLPICMYCVYLEMCDAHIELHQINSAFVSFFPCPFIFRYVDVCTLSDCHINHLWLHSNATKFEWEMFVMLFGHIGIRLYAAVGSPAQQFELHAAIAM